MGDMYINIDHCLRVCAMLCFFIAICFYLQYCCSLQILSFYK